MYKVHLQSSGQNTLFCSNYFYQFFQIPSKFPLKFKFIALMNKDIIPHFCEFFNLPTSTALPT